LDRQALRATSKQEFRQAVSTNRTRCGSGLPGHNIHSMPSKTFDASRVSGGLEVGIRTLSRF
jgi:hypothetical protein